MVEHKFRARVELDVHAGRERKSAIPRSDIPFCIALLGDFGGRGLRGERAGAEELARHRPVLVDPDDFDGVLAGFAPELRLRAPVAEGPPVYFRATTLDGFHPDRLFEDLPIFASLRELRRLAGDPASFRRAAALQRPSAEASATPAAASPHATGGLLDRILAESAPAPMAPPSAGDLPAYLRRIVEPHLVPAEDPRQAELLAGIDAATGALMRVILHNPDFQALEALWRGVEFLVGRIETGVDLRLYLLDISKAELAADLTSPGEATAAPEQTGLHRLLGQGPVDVPQGIPWAVAIGLYAFGPDADDLGCLSRITELARATGTPWITAAAPGLAGVTSFEATSDLTDWQLPATPGWRALRHAPGARYLGFATPRFLLRTTYGEAGEPCNAFPFEEMQTAPAHEDYLWGNPALLYAVSLGCAFAVDGWELRPGRFLDVDRLPLNVIAGSPPVMKPCAETWLSERVTAGLLDHGIMPVASRRDASAVRLVDFRSISAPPAPLAGRWRSGATPT